MGRHEDALRVDEAAVGIFRKLAETDPSVMHFLGYSLENLGLNLSAVGRHKEAMAAGEEAVDICSKLSNPTVDSELSLANRLKQLGTYLDARDRHGDAVRSREKGAVNWARRILSRPRTPFMTSPQISVVSVATKMHYALRKRPSGFIGGLRRRRRSLLSPGTVSSLWSLSQGICAPSGKTPPFG
ncbi:hypothetical protein B0H11DRAFT_13291 [Mycena galericulata]|nr:hypothetical protein B0H11DRAFT_431792 [Mycena galericulata]KAJ7512934.1 hypothetical protein B0H11DRAFT_13291 [Mycena galericulata]